MSMYIRTHIHVYIPYVGDPPTIEYSSNSLILNKQHNSNNSNIIRIIYAVCTACIQGVQLPVAKIPILLQNSADGNAYMYVCMTMDYVLSCNA